MRTAHVVRSDSFGGVERYISLVAPRLAAMGCKVTVIGGDPTNMIKISGSVDIRPARTTFAVARELVRLGPQDVVHAHMTAAELAAVATRHWHKARLVSTLHFAIPRASAKRALPLRLLGHFIDEEIAISQFVANATRESRVLYNAVEVSDPGPRQREPVVLVMQRLEAEKRTEVALRAWSVSTLRQKGWRLLIAGRGSESGNLRHLSRELQLANSVEWLGFLEEPSELLARVGLLLATAPAEPFGLSVVEAMARATPVIATDGGAHPETIGADGWLFPVNDVAACARLLDQAQERDLIEYGLRLRARQQQFFDIDRHVEALVQIYQSLVARGLEREGSTRRRRS